MGRVGLGRSEGRWTILHTIEELRVHFEDLLQGLVREVYGDKEPIQDLCAYALLGPGKRIRPLLTLFVTRHLGSSWEEGIVPALAIEMIHTYSLVHDDLPAIDDDALRRGRPTVHTVSNEGMAVITGDALLTDAFRLISDPTFFSLAGPLATEIRLTLIQEISSAGGSWGMIGGQAKDISGGSSMSISEIEEMHRLKTGKLMGAACACGAIVAQADQETVRHFRHLGEQIGLAFQIQDDILDHTEWLGKSPGKDKKLGKSTFSTSVDIDLAQKKLNDLYHHSLHLISQYPSEVEILTPFIQSIYQRQCKMTVT